MTPTRDTTGESEARIIKFRAWNGDAMSEPFCPWELIREETGGLITPGGFSVWWPKENGPQSFVWYQFTGLFDRAGKEIYEGDVVLWRNHIRDGSGRYEPKRSVISWDEKRARLGFDGHPLDKGFCLESMEVVGNIMQNPELLA